MRVHIYNLLYLHARSTPHTGGVQLLDVDAVFH